MLARLLFVVLAGASSVIAQGMKLDIITEDYIPYTIEDGGKIKGISVDLVNAIMDELGEEHKITVYPGARAHMMLEKLPRVMSFSLFRTPEREEKYKWIGPIANESIFFYKRKDDPRIFETIEDVKKVDTVAAFYQGAIFNELSKQGLNNIVKITTNESLSINLIESRVDLAVSANSAGVAYYLEKINQPPDAIVRTKVKLMEYPLYIACSKDIPDSVIEKWQRALQTIKASGQHEAIIKKYIK
jgi:polar amino acid transport system substrate-binding protein